MRRYASLLTFSPEKVASTPCCSARRGAIIHFLIAPAPGGPPNRRAPPAGPVDLSDLWSFPAPKGDAMLLELAATVVKDYLVPYAAEGLRKLTEVATQRVGAAAAEKAAQLAQKAWDRVKAVFSLNQEDQVILNQFEKYPEPTKGLMEIKLKEKLEQDPQLVKELQALVDAPTADAQGTGAQIIGATYAGIVDLRGANVSGSGFTAIGVNVGTRPPEQPAGPRSGPPPSTP